MSTAVAVVTGGTRGIGRAISLALGAEAYRVYSIFAHDREAASALAEEAARRELDVQPVRADLTDEDSFRCFRKRVEAETGRVDVLVHCAASGVHREAAALTPRHLSWTLSLNVVGAHRAVYELLPLMPSGGRIIGISSMGATRAVEYYAAVGASKGALEALFRHYARELAPRGIAVNLVSPGLVLTDVVAALPECERRTMAAQSRTPTGRLTTPEDVAGIVRFLCTPAGAQIVGDTIVVDGGRRLLV